MKYKIQRGTKYQLYFVLMTGVAVLGVTCYVLVLYWEGYICLMFRLFETFKHSNLYFFVVHHCLWILCFRALYRCRNDHGANSWRTGEISISTIEPAKWFVNRILTIEALYFTQELLRTFWDRGARPFPRAQESPNFGNKINVITYTDLLYNSKRDTNNLVWR
jgi:hypothetical protein